MAFGLLRHTAAVALAAACVAASARAATVTFDSGHTFSDTSTLIKPNGGYAVHFGSNAYTTASSADGTGITFEAGPASTGSSSASGSNTSTNATGNVTLTNLSGTSAASLNNIRQSASYLGTSTAPTKSSVADANFANIVGTADYAGHVASNTLTGTFQLTLNNLIVGQAYTLQLYFVDARTSSNGYTVGLANSVDASDTLVSPTTFQYAFGASGNTVLGGYDLATFTADAASQSIYLNTFNASNASANGQINALVLQGPVNTPEPTVLSMAGGAAFGLLGRRSRR